LNQGKGGPRGEAGWIWGGEAPADGGPTCRKNANGRCRKKSASAQGDRGGGHLLQRMTSFFTRPMDKKQWGSRFRMINNGPRRLRARSAGKSSPCDWLANTYYWIEPEESAPSWRRHITTILPFVDVESRYRCFNALRAECSSAVLWAAETAVSETISVANPERNSVGLDGLLGNRGSRRHYSGQAKTTPSLAPPPRKAEWGRGRARPELGYNGM